MKNDEAHEAHEAGPETATTPLEAAALEYGIDLEIFQAFVEDIQEVADAINNQDYTAPAISKLFKELVSLSPSRDKAEFVLDEKRLQEALESEAKRQYQAESLGLNFTFQKWASLSPEDKVERLAHKVRRLLDRLQRLEQDHFESTQDFYAHQHTSTGELVTRLHNRRFNPCTVGELQRAPNLNDPLDAMD